MVLGNFVLENASIIATIKKIGNKFAKNRKNGPDMKKGVSKIEMLVSLAILVFGMSIFAVTFPRTIVRSHVIEENLLSRIIANNYAVALHARAAGFGLDFVEDGSPISMNGLEGDSGGGIVFMRDSSKVPGGFDVAADYEGGGLFFPELENSQGEMFVRILFNRSRASGGTPGVMFKISVRSESGRDVYDFWTFVADTKSVIDS